MQFHQMLSQARRNRRTGVSVRRFGIELDKKCKKSVKTVQEIDENAYTMRDRTQKRAEKRPRKDLKKRSKRPQNQL